MSINKVILVGRVTSEPQKFECKSGIGANFSVVTNNRKGNENIPTFHSCVTFGKTAEIAVKYLKKGMQVYVEGSIEHQDYITKEGIKKNSTKIIVFVIEMLGAKTQTLGAKTQTLGANQKIEQPKESEIEEYFPPSQEDDIPW
jgi:single-strand DNA-binding protein